ncbi:putative HNH endonuclease [Pseudoalteromonas phage J2-1_QLiu-2017]|nr:putative HNH endonuclease [Pseudoalteromonas phage J2-1_QLiu-2017]
MSLNVSINPWETPEGKKVWKTKAQYFTWLRGALRRLWADYPLRKEWKARQLRPVTAKEKKEKKFHPSTKNVGQCHYCKEWFAGSKLECDHILASEGCTSFETAVSFLQHCGMGNGSEWVLTCKPCHKVKSYGEKYNYSFEEARAVKQAIAICGNAATEKKYLTAVGIEPHRTSAGRRKQLEQFFLEEARKGK